ncbi:hypothetical protein D9619_013640 [Psilocybe cf. subviscida]|uniref:DUF6589 domain-containing protein n=1 Tax=Psilocybe cf. subviscida TaxID=2480587 RepID=A0A8H5F8X1_9AGAR|nr:hypothetical protein D9619_013640 [Psilocybe cf. subviscida]
MAEHPSETPTRPVQAQKNPQLFTPITPAFTFINDTPLPLYPREQPLLTKSTPLSARKPAKKRKNDENVNPTPSKRPKDFVANPFLVPEDIAGTKQADFTVYDKLRLFHGFLATELCWSFGEFLFYATMTTGELRALGIEIIDNKLNHPYAFKPATIRQRTASLQHFFNGHGTTTPVMVIKQWWKSPFGRKHRDSAEMYCTSKPYSTIGPVRPGISSFAAQIIGDRLVTEANKAIRTDSGLHVSLSGKSASVKAIEWPDIGATTFPSTQLLQSQYQPLSRHLLERIGARTPRSVNGESGGRQKRPVETVVTGVLSTLNFSRSSSAKLMPLAAGLLYLGLGASFDLFRYRSRLGEMPSYSSVLRALRALAKHEAFVTFAHGRDPETLGFIFLDNVQNYILQRDPGIGRENKLIIGIAATYYECFIPERLRKAFCIDAKAKSIAEGKRRDVTVKKLLGLIDNAHIERVCVLQWLRVLIHAIPELSHLKPEIARRYKTDAAKQRLPLVATKCHPLASSSRNETILTELKAAVLDFLDQTGQTRDNFKRFLFAFGGDGLTFEKMKQLHDFLQFEGNDFDALRIVQPLLAWWHTEWTNLSRLIESHWGTVNSEDPSSLGYSAEKIGHKKPSNLKKVDFYTSRDLAFDVLDARLLDCWRLLLCPNDDLFEYFTCLEQEKKLPTFETLLEYGKKLYNSYTSLRAQTKAEMGRPYVSPAVSTGTPWPTPASDSPFEGDQSLMRSISFMRDTMFAREFSLATAEGDVGRIWEMVKIMVFTFAASSHSKYTQYLLETLVDLEYESTPELREGLLHMTLVNLTGREGHWSAGDFMQEYFNRLLEAVFQRKGIDYGDPFVRQVWSRNLQHIARLKMSWLDGVGLNSRSRRHTGAKRVAEQKILLLLYKETELHSFRAGRQYTNEAYVDDFTKGVTALESGKLKRWCNKTIRFRNLADLAPMETAPLEDNMEDSDSDSDDESDDEDGSDKRPDVRFSAVIDNEIVVEPVEVLEQTFNAILDEESDVSDDNGDLDEEDESADDEDM